MARYQNQIFCVHQPAAVPSVGGVLVVAGCVSVVVTGGAVMWCGMMSCGWLRSAMKKCGWLWGGARWGNVGDVMSCHVMICDVMSCGVMWCGVMSCDVMWCNVMWCDVKCVICDVMCEAICDVMWCAVMWCAMMWSDAMGWDVTCMWCVAMWMCDVVNWEMMCCELRRAHDSETIERSIPMCGETLRCKPLWDYRDFISQYYDSVLQVIHMHCNYDVHVTTTAFMFGSRNTGIRKCPVHCVEYPMGSKT